MLSILRTEPASEEITAGPPIHFEEAQAAEPAEFEIVLGRRQLASVLFVATIAIAVFSSLAYLAGKSIAPAPEKVEVIRTVTVPVVETPLPTQPISETLAKTETPIFADPRQGPLYLQMGAVEKGIAVIFVEGLRKHGFDAFAAPGPDEKIFRVLIGPLADEQAFLKAKNATDQIGLGTFGRRYQQ
jgi:cell division septation protein DedD